MWHWCKLPIGPPHMFQPLGLWKWSCQWIWGGCPSNIRSLIFRKISNCYLDISTMVDNLFESDQNSSDTSETPIITSTGWSAMWLFCRLWLWSRKNLWECSLCGGMQVFIMMIMMITMMQPKHRLRCWEGLKYNATYASIRMNYLLPTNELGRTQLALGGTQNANQEWRAASFVKTYNALKVIVVEEDKSVCRSLMVNIVLLKLNDTHILRGIFWHKKGGFSGCANDSNCPGFDSVCDPIDHSNCSFCDNNNCTGGKPDHQKTTTITITTTRMHQQCELPPSLPCLWRRWICQHLRMYPHLGLSWTWPGTHQENDLGWGGNCSPSVIPI